MKRVWISWVLLAALLSFTLWGCIRVNRVLEAADHCLYEAQSACLTAEYSAAAGQIQAARRLLTQKGVLLRLLIRRDFLTQASAELAGLEALAREETAAELLQGLAKAQLQLEFLNRLFGWEFW